MAANDWNVSDPIDHLAVASIPQEIRNVESATKHILLKEHAEPSTAGAGGQHLQGSSRVYLQSALPTSDPEGNNLDTSATSDNGRLAILTGSNNIIKVYAQTSAGISTSWVDVSVGKLLASEAVNFNGFNASGVGTGTQSGQLIHVGQLDTSFFSIFEPATGAALKLKQTNTPSTGVDIANKAYVDYRGFSYSGATVFNSALTAANTWQDLDLSSIVGARRALVLLQATSDTGIYVAIKPKGTGDIFSRHYTSDADGCACCNTTGSKVMFLICCTDASGVLSIAATNNSSVLTLVLFGFIG